MRSELAPYGESAEERFVPLPRRDGEVNDVVIAVAVVLVRVVGQRITGRSAVPPIDEQHFRDPVDDLVLEGILELPRKSLALGEGLVVWRAPALRSTPSILNLG